MRGDDDSKNLEPNTSICMDQINRLKMLGDKGRQVLKILRIFKA